MAYKWRPTASQRRAFAQRMQDPEEKAAYETRKKERIEKQRSESKFDYNTAGGYYVATRRQHDFVLNNIHLFNTLELEQAANEVTSSYTCNTKTHHDNIHIVNSIMRKTLTV